MRRTRLSLVMVLAAGILAISAGTASAEATTCIAYDRERPIICVG